MTGGIQDPPIDELADRLFAAVSSFDFDALRRLYADDVVIWMNYEGVEKPADEAIASHAATSRAYAEVRYEQVRREIFDGGFVQQHVLSLRSNDGATMKVPACLVVRVARGKIVRIDEYLDPRPFFPGHNT